MAKLLEDLAMGELVQEGPVRLNLGAGGVEIPGYTSIDRKAGQEAYPLDVADSSVDEILASHILEHFSHRDVSAVVNHWVEKLKPGGKLKIAVPDFGWICEKYQAGEPINLQGYLMGGHEDENDVHKCTFDNESLHQIMANAGLERIGRWKSRYQDCAALAVSLNLVGFKPVPGEYKAGMATAILSAPRFAPTMHMRCSSSAFGQLRIPYRIAQGAYWHQVMSETIELQRTGSKYLITCDYDSVFSPQDVHELLRIMQAYPDVDALFPVQVKRQDSSILASTRDEVFVQEFDQNIREMDTGHFGLTVFRSSRFEGLPRPWFDGITNDDGRWADGKVDPDIYFWRNWKESGRNVFIAPRVAIGHMQEVIVWPRTSDLGPVYQNFSDFDSNGIPQEVER